MSGHRFPVERLHLLKDPERLRRSPPEPLLRVLEIAPGSTVVDIGAGTGFWTLPLSRLVGDTGMVYAVDIEPVMLDELRALKAEHDLSNVQIIRSEELTVPLPDGIANAVVAGFVLHEPPEQKAFVHELLRMLTVGGRLLLVDWHKRETEHGPPEQYRVAQEDAENLLARAGLAVTILDSPNPDVYALLGRAAG